MPRSSLLLLLAVPAIAASAAAQGFEGSVTMTITSTVGGKPNDASMKTATRGGRTVFTIVLGSGPQAGTEVRSIMDRKANTLTTLMRMPPGVQMPPAKTGGVNARGFVMVTPLSDTSNTSGGRPDTPPGVRRLGTSETIAGMHCDDYEITERNTTPISACITTALGAFVYPPTGRGIMAGPGIMSGRGAENPRWAWAGAFGDKPGFPLKVWSADGKISQQVTAIDKTPAPDSVFAIPEGYVAMPGRGR